MKYTDKTCTEYNPFYSNGLYVMNDEIKMWSDLNLKALDFNKTLLDKMTCEKYKLDNPGKLKPEAACDATILATPHLPQ